HLPPYLTGCWPSAGVWASRRHWPMSVWMRPRPMRSAVWRQSTRLLRPTRSRWMRRSIAIFSCAPWRANSMADTGAMKIGILQCDSVPAELQPEFGDYPDMFRRLLTKADPRLDFAVYDLVHEEMPADLNACDAWLFTGSKCGANDDSAWIRHAGELVRSLHAQRRPTVGICFGHQMIARTLGGRVERARDWGVGVHTTQLLRQRPWMQPARHELSLLVSHQDQVVELPPDAVHLAS